MASETKSSVRKKQKIANDTVALESEVSTSESDEAKPHVSPGERPWNLLLLVSLRFAVVYFTLTFLDSPFLLNNPFPATNKLHIERWIPLLADMLSSYTNAWHQLVSCVARNIFHLQESISFSLHPSDSTYGWIRTLCTLVIASLVVIVWSIVDRKRKGYPVLNEWFRLSLRMYLSLILLHYGMGKVLLLQFADPTCSELATPVGQLSHSSLLWIFMGVSHGYCIFGGLAEVIPAALLLFRRFTLLGALLSMAVMLNVFLLNLCYGVPVKQLCLHLILISAILIMPDARRLWRMFLLNAIVVPSSMPLFSNRKWIHLAATILPVVWGSQALLMDIRDGSEWAELRKHDIAALKAQVPFYGVWEATNFKMDGIELPPSESRKNRWQRICFNAPSSCDLFINDRDKASFCSWSEDRKLLVLGTVENEESYSSANALAGKWKPQWTTDKSIFNVNKQSADAITLQGKNDDRELEITLQRIDSDNLPLMRESFALPH